MKINNVQEGEISKQEKLPRRGSFNRVGKEFIIYRKVESGKSYGWDGNAILNLTVNIGTTAKKE